MYNECRHILTNGNRCQSPALRHHDFCYFHSVHRAQPPLEATFDLNLPPLEDPDAIQLALSQLAQALAANKIDIRRARALAMVLRIASANFRHTIAGQRLLQKKSEPQQDPAPALYEQQMVRETCSHSDGTSIAPPKECPDPEEVPEPEHKWSLGRLLLRDAEEFRQRKLKEQAELERQIRDTQRGARFFGFEPDPPQPDTLPTLEATAEDNPPVLTNLQKKQTARPPHPKKKKMWPGSTSCWHSTNMRKMHSTHNPPDVSPGIELTSSGSTGHITHRAENRPLKPRTVMHSGHGPGNPCVTVGVAAIQFVAVV